MGRPSKAARMSLPQTAAVKEDDDGSMEASPSRSGSASPDDREKVRVWWPPTLDAERTGFSGAYWPASVVSRDGKSVSVQYDNGDIEIALEEHVFPDAEPPAGPAGFGQEATPLAVGEFCEVHNDSRTDPCAWLARIKTSEIGAYTVEYPFHDSKPERVSAHLIRRGRIRAGNRWLGFRPCQEWASGTVISPRQLETMEEPELLQWAREAILKAASEPKPVRQGKKRKTDAADTPPAAGNASTSAAAGSSGNSAGAGAKGAVVEDEAAAAAAGKPAAAAHPTAAPAAAAFTRLIAASATATMTGEYGGLAGFYLKSKPDEITPGTKVYGPFLLVDRGDGQLPLMVEYKPPLPAPIIPIPVAGAAPRAKQLAPGSGTPRKPGRPRKNQPLERASSDGDPLAPFWPSPVARPGGGAAVAAPAGAAAAAAAAAGDDAATQPAKRARKEKAAKDPRKPKKPLSSYIVFLQRQMSTVKAAHPGLPISEITKILGEMWAKADPEEKAACDAVVQADRARYEREMATYVKPSPTAGIAAAAIAQVAAATAAAADAAPPQAPAAKAAVAAAPAAAAAAPAAAAGADAGGTGPSGAAATTFHDRFDHPMSSYELFQRELMERPDYAALPPAESNKAVKLAWLSLDEARRQAYEQQALQELTKQAGGRKKSKSAPAFSAELSESTEHDDATIFASFDLNKAKTKMLKTFQPEAFDLLVGAWRPDSPKAADAIRSWKMHIWGAVRPNMKAFMIGIFGMEAVTGMLRMDDEDSK